MEILHVENLSFRYPNTSRPALSGVSFSIQRGEFVALCGATGSGKSTLLRLLKPELIQNGEKSGDIFIEKMKTSELSIAQSAEKIGYVMQNPDHQTVTDRVWSELAFGLENLGVSQKEIARRVAETAAYFGLTEFFERETATLSGGERQLLNLASVMVMNPELLILDEPTASLDPIAAQKFLDTVMRLNKERGLSIIIAEHRLEKIISLCDRIIILENGKTAGIDTPQNITRTLNENQRLLPFFPPCVRLFHALDGEGKCPLSVSEGREFFEEYAQKRQLPQKTKREHETYPPHAKKALTFKNVRFRYERTLPDVLRGLNLTVYENEIFAILGANGSGKTTMLSCAAGVLRPYSGKITVFDKPLNEYKNQSLYHNCLTVLPQDVTTVFLKNTVKEELDGSLETADCFPFDLSPLFDKHPYDLSGGEQQLVALMKALGTKPRLLLLDEPTKGLDAGAKSKLVRVLKSLKETGMTVVIVTHDVEFSAMCADRAAMFFRGEMVSEGTPAAFFSENNFYTTMVSLITRGVLKNTVTVEDVLSALIESGGKS